LAQVNFVVGTGVKPPVFRQQWPLRPIRLKSSGNMLQIFQPFVVGSVQQHLGLGKQ
jgi:hypothetical protein